MSKNYGDMAPGNVVSGRGGDGLMVGLDDLLDLKNQDCSKGCPIPHGVMLNNENWVEEGGEGIQMAFFFQETILHDFLLSWK